MIDLKDLNDREGPMDKVVPEQRYKVCSGCKYLDTRLHSHSFMHGGRYDSYCTHEANRVLPAPFPVAELIAEDEMFPRTPSWCPFLKEPR